MQPETKPKLEKGRIDPHQPMSYLLDSEYGLYIEGYFIERLCFERQRTARSKKPFLLMLLDIKKIPENDRRQSITKIAATLHSSVRETDLKGWYKHDSVIGVLFTEIGDINRISLRNKIYRNLSDKLKSDQASRIDISFHIFPEDSTGGPEDQRESFQKQNSDDSRVFYPDLSRHSLSRGFYFLTKRAMDLLGSIVCMIVLSPFFVVIPIVIKVSSKGPIIFRQERVGLYGKKFVFLKFRSMYVNNDSSIHREFVSNLIGGQKGNNPKQEGSGEGGVYKIRNDSRVTPVGRFLRKTSLDELPQLLNILMGDMSLVGPRPPIPYEVEKYEVWHRRRVLEVKPGLSGLWQVKGRSITTFDEMVRLDLKYMKERSIWLDMKIILQTPLAVLKTKGAY
jgi:lipopolysaccharide/colanic/teichoic acid biosynthesis glycosyltransferase/GGDEF domain-containing protein